MNARKRFVYERLRPTDIQIRAVGMNQCRKKEGFHWLVGERLSKPDLDFVKSHAVERGCTEVWLHYDSVINLNHVLWTRDDENRRVNVRTES